MNDLFGRSRNIAFTLHDQSESTRSCSEPCQQTPCPSNSRVGGRARDVTPIIQNDEIDGRSNPQNLVCRLLLEKKKLRPFIAVTRSQLNLDRAQPEGHAAG